MPDKAAEARVDALFAQTSVRTAQHQKLLREWLSGFSDQYPGQSRNDAQIEQEEKGIFNLEPEIAGLGAPTRSLDEDEISPLDPLSRSEDASTAFLRERLLGKKGKQKAPVVQRGTINLPGLEPGFQVNRIKAGNADPTMSVAANDNASQGGQIAELKELDDGEDDIGRSGVGKTKRAFKKVAEMDIQSTDADESGASNKPDEFLVRSEDDFGDGRVNAENAVAGLSVSKATTSVKRGLKRKQNKGKPKARSYLDDLLAQKEAKKQRKQATG